MPAMTIIAMAETGYHAGNETWPPLELASKIFDLSSFVLIGALVVGAVATILIVWMGIVKEHHWDVDRTAQRERIAQTVDSLLATFQAGRQNALTTLANISTTEAMAVSQGLMKRSSTNEATRCLYINPTIQRFAGKQFDAVVTSSALDLGALLGSLKSALKTAGWIEIARPDPTAGVGLLTMDKAAGPALVRIQVDASKDPELLDAAKALASALNAEDIAAIVKTEADTTNANVIHILVGPKP